MSTHEDELSFWEELELMTKKELLRAWLSGDVPYYKALGSLQAEIRKIEDEVS